MVRDYKKNNQSVKGLRFKLCDLRLLLATCVHDVIIFTETNLLPSISTGSPTVYEGLALEIFIPSMMITPKSKSIINPMKCRLHNLYDELSTVS